MVVDWSECGTADHLALGGKRRRAGVGVHASSLSVSHSAAAAFRLVPVVGESPVSGQKPQPLSQLL